MQFGDNNANAKCTDVGCIENFEMILWSNYNIMMQSVCGILSVTIITMNANYLQAANSPFPQTKTEKCEEVLQAQYP